MSWGELLFQDIEGRPSIKKLIGFGSFLMIIVLAFIDTFSIHKVDRLVFQSFSDITIGAIGFDTSEKLKWLRPNGTTTPPTS